MILGLFGRRHLVGAVLFLLAYWYLTPTDQRMAHDFSLPIAGESNEELTLASYQGQPIIVNFWATWCKNCQREKEVLVRLREQMTVISVLTNDFTPEPSDLAGRLVVLDRDGQVANLYGVKHLPQTFLIDADSRIVEHWRKPLTDGVVSKIIEQLPNRYGLDGWL